VTVTRILQLVVVLWVASEVALVGLTRARRLHAYVRDRGSLVLFWGAIVGSLAGALALRPLSATLMPLPTAWLHGIALLLLGGGLGIRWAAILTLGRFFNTAVTIHADHRLIRSGPFRWVRHPSYAGVLLAFLGLGVSFGNWLSLLVLCGPILAAVLHRIRVEEAALVEALGAEYTAYRKATRRLIPGLF